MDMNTQKGLCLNTLQNQIWRKEQQVTRGLDEEGEWGKVLRGQATEILRKLHIKYAVGGHAIEF